MRVSGANNADTQTHGRKQPNAATQHTASWQHHANASAPSAAASHHNIPHSLQQSRSFPAVHYRGATQRQRAIALWRRILLFILIVRRMQPADRDGRHNDERFGDFTAFGHSGSMHTHTYFAAFLDGRGSCRRGTGSEEHRCQLWTTLVREAPALALFVCKDYIINRYVCSCKFRKI